MMARAALAEICAAPRKCEKSPFRVASSKRSRTSGSRPISSSPSAMRPMSSRNASTSAMRSSFSGVFESDAQGAAPSASLNACVPAAAAPVRAATSYFSLSAAMPSKRMLGSRSSEFRSAVKVTPFVATPKSQVARAICSGVSLKGGARPSVSVRLTRR